MSVRGPAKKVKKNIEQELVDTQNKVNTLKQQKIATGTKTIQQKAAGNYEIILNNLNSYCYMKYEGAVILWQVGSPMH